MQGSPSLPGKGHSACALLWPQPCLPVALHLVALHSARATHSTSGVRAAARSDHERHHYTAMCPAGLPVRVDRHGGLGGEGQHGVVPGPVRRGPAPFPPPVPQPPHMLTNLLQHRVLFRIFLVHPCFKVAELGEQVGLVFRSGSHGVRAAACLHSSCGVTGALQTDCKARGKRPRSTWDAGMSTVPPRQRAAARSNSAWARSETWPGSSLAGRHPRLQGLADRHARPVPAPSLKLPPAPERARGQFFTAWQPVRGHGLGAACIAT